MKSFSYRMQLNESFNSRILKTQLKMIRIICAVIIFLTCNLHYSLGYKWVTLKPSDSIPVNAIILSVSPTKYVGRIIHYNLVLPAEVYNSTYAVALYDSEELVKSQFEVLVANEHCEWKRFIYYEDVPENVVHGGNAWNAEPIYIGKTETYSNTIHIDSILFQSKERVDKFYRMGRNNRYALVCDDDTTWVDASSGNIPDNAVISSPYGKCFVARLLGNYSFVPGEVCNGIAAVRQGGLLINSHHFQVLTVAKEKYKWYTNYIEKIPDYAVVGGRAKNNELMYVAREQHNNKAAIYIVHSEASGHLSAFEYLVKNIN